MTSPLRILIVGCGHMGTSHALAYQASPDFEIVGLVSRGEVSRTALVARLDGATKIALFDDYVRALETIRPDAVCICTYPDTHADYANKALEAGCHVFLEKPVATTVEDAERLVQLAHERGLKLVIGYILQHHPTWQRFVEEAQQLGKPLVMRMNLNQQSSGDAWRTHKEIMRSMSPIVDCGVHYVEVMCRMTASRPKSVSAIGVRLTGELPPHTYNYGQLQIRFEDGSVGWYEAGWGPMMSQSAFFIKDVIGPKGSLSIMASKETLSDSSDINSHTRTDSLLFHSGKLQADGTFAEADRSMASEAEPDHDALCAREQEFFRRAIRENLDLSSHWDAAIDSLKIVLAADESVRTGQTVLLS